MRRASRPRPTVALFIVCLSLGLSADPGAPGLPPHPTRAVPTVEPLPPLSLELGFSDRQEWSGGGAAVLHTEIVAGDEIADLRLNLDLSAGLTLRGDSNPRAEQGRFHAGERRIQRLAVAASHEGSFPVMIEAEARLADGRTFRVGQGITLRFGSTRPEGRRHNGAFEVRGRTLSELRR